jgi:hypothetical protein
MPVSFALGDWTETLYLPTGSQWVLYRFTFSTNGGQLVIGVFAGGDDRGFLDAVILSEVPEPMPILVLVVGCAALAASAGTRRMRLR